VLSLVLPTYNEAKNLDPLLARLRATVGELTHEFIVVDDDSPDRTWEEAERLSQKYGDVRVLRRVGRRGLSTAVAEGFEGAIGDVLIVMDADGQHDPTLIMHLYDAVMIDGKTLAVASRYVEGGGAAGLSGSRVWFSRLGNALARSIPPVRVSDPMSGFFAIDRRVYRRITPLLRPSGFKILLEILGALPAGTPVAEIPLEFGERWSGESKFSLRVRFQFLWQLVRIGWRRMTG
jgi:dolichol-phosphate mannosyltransferase